MKLIFFCENANQVHISQSIANSIYFPTDILVEVALLDWDRETASWVYGAVTSLGWSVPVVNMIDEDPGFRRAFNSAKSKDGVLKDIVFEYLRHHLTGQEKRLVQFNDRSMRGRAVAAICRNIGVRRMLVQDGFLNFVSKTASLEKSDQNYGWGSSNPEHLAVWGSAMAEALVERHHTNERNIHVVGVTKPNMVIPKHVAHKPVEGEIKVLWADQAIIDQRKADQDIWLEEFRAIAVQLSNFKADLRLHPSTKEATRALLEESTEGRFTAQVPERPQMSQDDLRQYDVVVTYYSTVFIDCLINNIPCVVYKTKSLDIELPVIEHPLIVYCTENESLSDAVIRAAAIFSEMETPPRIFDYVLPEDGAENIAKLISDLLPAAPSEAQDIKPYGLDVLLNARRLQSGIILILSTSFGDHIGVGKPIKAFSEYAKGLGLDFDFHLVANGDMEALLLKVSRASMILMNGFDVVKTLPQEAMLAISSTALTRRIPLVFYCHETQFVYRRLLDTLGGRIQVFTDKVLPVCHVLAVSDQQADWLASMGARNIRTVYNAVGSGFKPVDRVPSDRPIVLMVGTQQKRKGVELFSHVADLAKSSGLDWEFVWLGAYTKDADGLYRSPEVNWHGHVEADQVREWLSKSSVFFLSSIDDPMPLGVGEALATGVPCVAFKDTGFSDFIDHHSAGAVFTYYEARSALAALEKVIVDKHVKAVDPNAVMSIVGIDAFGRRMMIALGEMMISTSPSRKYTPPLASPIALHRVRHANKVDPVRPANKADPARPANKADPAKPANKADPAKPANKVNPKKRRTTFIWFLDILEAVLPGIVVRPGKKLLIAFGLIGKKR